VSPSFDERWEAWQAKGAAHDRAVRRKLAIAVPFFAVVAGAIFYAPMLAEPKWQAYHERMGRGGTASR
jgi:hypothetical protein